MSEAGTEALEWATALHGAWNREGVAGYMPFFAENAEWHDPTELPDAAIYRGHEAIVAHLQDWEQGGVFEIKFEIENALRSGDRILISTVAYGLGAQSRTPSGSLRVFYLYLLRGGQIARADVFLDRSDALEAAGLPE